MYLHNSCFNIVHVNTVFEIETYNMESRAGLEHFFPTYLICFKPHNCTELVMMPVNMFVELKNISMT